MLNQIISVLTHKYHHQPLALYFLSLVSLQFLTHMLNQIISVLTYKYHHQPLALYFLSLVSLQIPYTHAEPNNLSTYT